MMMTFPKAKNLTKDGTVRAGNYLLPKLRIEDQVEIHNVLVSHGGPKKTIEVDFERQKIH